MALISSRSAGQFLPLFAAFLLLGVGPVASAADPDEPPARSPDPAGPVGEVVSSSQLRVAASASPALDLERLSDATRQAGSSERRGASPLSEARKGVMGHLGAVAGGLLVVALVVAGIALTVAGLREDLRKRRRGYRRRSRRSRGPIRQE